MANHWHCARLRADSERADPISGLHSMSEQPISSVPAPPGAGSGSMGYADLLSPKRNLGGQLGAVEFSEGFDDVVKKAQQLANWVR